jgi:hypothetical protein
MPRSDRSEFVAFAAVLCTVLVFLVGFTAGGNLGSRNAPNEPAGQPNTAAAESYQEFRGPSEGYWWPEFSTRDTYAQWAMSILALVATGTGILGVIWIRQTLDATRETAKAAERSNVQASLAVMSAHEANVIARDSSRVQARAYVSINEATAENTKYDGTRVWIVFKNSGQTPAYNSLVRKGIEIRSVEEVDADIYGEREVDPLPTHIIGPGGSMQVRVSLPLSSEERKMLKFGITKVIAFGDITYEDIFERKHLTEFNLEVLGFDTDDCRVSPIGKQNGAD